MLPSLYNTVSLKIPVPKSHPVRGILGANYRPGGWVVPVSKWREVESRGVQLPTSLREYCKEMERNSMMAESIAHGNHNSLMGYDFLLKHQKVAFTIASLVPRFAFFMDTGTGKTATMLSVIDASKSDEMWLVVAPKPILRTAWRDDAKKFFPDMPLLVYDREITKADLTEFGSKHGFRYASSRKEEMLDEALMHCQVCVINPELFKRNIVKFKTFDNLIIDESTMVKNPSSDITKAITAYAEERSRVYLLTGEPTPNSLEDIFSQARLIDPSALGYFVTAFRQRYFIPSGYGGYDLTPLPKSHEQIAEKLKPIAYYVKKEDCLDLPPKTYQVKEFTLTPDAMRTYNQMRRDFITEVHKETVEAVTKGAAIMKLRQLVAGFIMKEGAVYDVHSTRLNLLSDTLDEIGKDKQVIIWGQFRHEIAAIEKMLKDKGKTVCTGYGGTKDLQDSIDGFKSGKYQYMVAHPRTLMFGVTFTNCSYAVYYSYSYNFEEYYQSHDRIYRMGQTLPCTFITLKCTNSIDEAMLRAVRDKKTEAAFISDLIRGIENGTY